VSELVSGYAEFVPDSPEIVRMAERLPELKAACNTVVKALLGRVHKGEVLDDYVVNWGDLACVRAEVCLDDGGNLGWRVRVEEAAPENAEFQADVSRGLEALGFPDVYVETAW